jgi:hypothetical protein
MLLKLTSLIRYALAQNFGSSPCPYPKGTSDHLTPAGKKNTGKRSFFLQILRVIDGSQKHLWVNRKFIETSNV